MDMIQIVYSSQPFGYDEAMLSGILLDARRCNNRDGVTGALVCRRDMYLQLLEGPKPQVLATYARIKQDDRHVNITLHRSSPISERLFGSWDMFHDPAQSWHWSETDVSRGTIGEASEAEFLDVFTRLKEDVAQLKL